MTEAIKANRRPTQSFSKRPGKKSHSSFILFIAPSGVYTDPSHCFMNVVPLRFSWGSCWREGCWSYSSSKLTWHWLYRLQQLNHHNSIRYVAAKLYLSTVQNWCFDCHKCWKGVWKRFLCEKSGFFFLFIWKCKICVSVGKWSCQTAEFLSGEML